MEVFKRFVNEFNTMDDHLRKTSMTVPDDSLSIRELYERYVTGALDQSLAMSNARAEYDGENPDFDDYTPSLDAVSAYETGIMLQENRMRAEQEAQYLASKQQENEGVQMDRQSPKSSSGDSGNSGKGVSGEG
ncbi:hypothetical protein [Tortoise microvirus 49]|nr:hypothetical protein [Tortoise microvirus 49]